MRGLRGRRGTLRARLNGKSPRSRSSTTRSSRSELKEAADNLSDAAVALREAPKKQSARGGLGRFLLVGIVGAGLALALSEGLRKKVLDALFGAEEEFEYTSTTSSPTTTNAASGNWATSSTAGTTPAG